jgi:hypothetical protein
MNGRVRSEPGKTGNPERASPNIVFGVGLLSGGLAMKFRTILLSGALAMAFAGAASAQSANGTVNANIGSKGAATGTNGSLHSSANTSLNGSHRSLNGTANSTIGSAGAHAGTNGTLHSSANRRLNSAK